MAATLEVRDEVRGIVLRFQDDDDRTLTPILSDTVVRVREQLALDLGVELPKPLRVDFVRDQFTLAAMTGLPEEAARTTGTVAVAKWGRVTMNLARATQQGYPWLDTLAHEMTHLALSRGTREHAPLWLQEGVAKLEETRWRDRQPLDDVPAVDDVAKNAVDIGLARPFDKLGPSIAMLPTANEAAMAFAEVTSFVRYVTKTSAPTVLPNLLVRLKASDDIDSAIKDVSGDDLATWQAKWRAWLQAHGAQPAELADLATSAAVVGVARSARIGELFAARGHAEAAAISLGRAQVLSPSDAWLRAMLAAALIGRGDQPGARSLVASVQDLRSSSGRWWSLHGSLVPEPAQASAHAFELGVALDRFAPEVACEERTPPELPTDPFRRALCEAVRAAAR